MSVRPRALRAWLDASRLASAADGIAPSAAAGQLVSAQAAGRPLDLGRSRRSSCSDCWTSSSSSTRTTSPIRRPIAATGPPRPSRRLARACRGAPLAPRARRGGRRARRGARGRLRGARRGARDGRGAAPRAPRDRRAPAPSGPTATRRFACRTAAAGSCSDGRRRRGPAALRLHRPGGDPARFPFALLAFLLPSHLGCAIATALPDEPSDRESGKRTLPVRVGGERAARCVALLERASLLLAPVGLGAVGLRPGRACSRRRRRRRRSSCCWPAQRRRARACCWSGSRRRARRRCRWSARPPSPSPRAEERGRDVARVPAALVALPPARGRHLARAPGSAP